MGPHGAPVITLMLRVAVQQLSFALPGTSSLRLKLPLQRWVLTFWWHLDSWGNWGTRRLNSFNLRKNKNNLKFLILSLFFRSSGFYTVEFVVLNIQKIMELGNFIDCESLPAKLFSCVVSNSKRIKMKISDSWRNRKIRGNEEQGVSHAPIHGIRADLPLGPAYKLKAVLLLSPFGTDKNSVPGLILRAWQGHGFVYIWVQERI